MAFIQVNHVNVHYTIYNEAATETIVALHGFTGSTKTWQHVASFLPEARIVAIDLIGHGLTDSPQDVSYYSMDAQIELLYGVFEALHLERFHLLGYSMGGRVALSYAAKYGDMLQSLTLESASPGLLDATARAERKENDAKLAMKIQQLGIEAFVELWENIPLFASQKKLSQEVQLEVREERLNQTVMGLANSLLGMGTGDMPSVWQKLNVLQMPVFLLTGSLDEKFEHIALKMKQQNENFTHVTISGYGHAIHVENPEKFATIVKESILN